MSSKIAHPYAAAAYAYAKADGSAESWGAMFDALAEAEPAISAAALAARSSQGALAEAIADALDLQKDEGRRNFLRILAQNRRLGCAGDVARRFAEIRDEDEGRAAIHVESARAFDEASRKEFDKLLGAWSGRNARVTYSENPALLGGARVRVGDRVLDASIRGRLSRLAATLA